MRATDISPGRPRHNHDFPRVRYKNKTIVSPIEVHGTQIWLRIQFHPVTRFGRFQVKDIEVRVLVADEIDLISGVKCRPEPDVCPVWNFLNQESVDIENKERIRRFDDNQTPFVCNDNPCRDFVIKANRSDFFTVDI
jgi:hypothetical protein